MSPNVLYLSYDGLTDPLGQSQVLPYLVGLSKMGYSFTVISFEKQNSFEAKYAGIKSICDENQIEWIPLKYRKNPPVLSTVYNIFELWQKVKNLYRQKKFQIIHCRSYITSLVGLRARNKWSVKFIFDMRGFWADERVDGGLWNLKNPVYNLIYKYFKSKERDFLAQADAVVSLTHTAKKILINNFALPSQKITVIHCSVDSDLFNPSLIKEEEKDNLREALGISKNDFVLLYLGSIGTWYLLDEMFTFFKILSGKNKNSSFLIVTPDSPENIKATALKRDVDLTKVFIAKAERAKVPLHISLANASIFFIKPSFSKQASFPTKLGEVLSMGLPVIANSSVGDNDFLFSTDNLGVLLRDFKEEDYQDAAGQLLAFNTSNHLNDFASNNFSLRIGVGLYGEIYKSIL